MRTYLPVPFDEAKAANYKIHCNFYAKSGADGVYTFKYNVDDSAPYHMESVLGLLDARPQPPLRRRSLRATRSTGRLEV